MHKNAYCTKFNIEITHKMFYTKISTYKNLLFLPKKLKSLLGNGVLSVEFIYFCPAFYHDMQQKQDNSTVHKNRNAFIPLSKSSFLIFILCYL